ncbi:MAG: S8 family peptidase [Xanthobacteraceae bacterium]
MLQSTAAPNGQTPAGIGFGKGTDHPAQSPKGAPTGRAALDRVGSTQHVQQPSAARPLGFAGSQLQRRELPRAVVQNYLQRQVTHRQEMALARSRLPVRPLPGERGFTGVPPAGESRFMANEVVFQIGANTSQAAVDAAVRRLGLSTVGSYTSTLTGGTVLHLRIGEGRQLAEMVRALEAENMGIAQPNYVYRVQQDPMLAARTSVGDPAQYVVGKLQLGETHRVATGSNVLVAVIDSAVDTRHPDLAGSIVEQFDAVGRADRPHVHGTGMAGAIAAHRKLLGIAPNARILAVHAFRPDANESAQATTQHIIAGLEWAITKGARVINLSFAGPYDPMLQLAIKRAREKGVVLVAAVGNLGPNSPPLYPAADPNVIAVTATDQNDKVFAQANQGPYVAVAAPGVNILEPAPNAGYQVTTGTSVAAAHVSGVAALLLERNPSLDPAAVHEILTLSAKSIGPQGRDDKVGWGLIDPARALQFAEVRVAQDRKGTPAKLGSSPRPSTSAKAGTVSAR